MNRRIFFVGLFMMLVHLSGAQSKLEQCAIKRSRALSEIIKLKMDTDSMAAQRLAMIDKDWQDCVVDAPMPSFSLDAIPAGILDSKALKGKIVIINFWFTSCAPCIAEMPGLNKLVDEYKGNNVVFVGFTFENRSKIETEFLPSHHFDFKIIPEAGAMEKLFGINDYPSTFIVDASGRIRKAWSGGTNGPTAKDEVYQKIKPILDGLLSKKKEIIISGK